MMREYRIDLKTPAVLAITVVLTDIQDASVDHNTGTYIT